FWKTPGEDMIPVEIEKYISCAGCITMEFSHPEPIAKVAYELHLVSSANKVMVLSFDKDDLY
ncbi:MAG TPA: hypothetical protein DDZ89_08460, partial [Clostridiales bacterium]|nr:hypothetical protein [Clostridiales bacterium]